MEGELRPLESYLGDWAAADDLRDSRPLIKGLISSRSSRTVDSGLDRTAGRSVKPRVIANFRLMAARSRSRSRARRPGPANGVLP